eukprot:Protomagalhaensia_sp_Gyna_25__548@NODE_1258_length_2013_cov_157_623100_g1002_i0_p1_GENE_NODE_1258_length_2013_cov_157_623100_g1002_i0NODE_1258_length_2013_cov_157_623100_g1002_i0_p1_ORF_typecomplete_len534_score55_30Pkinase/PF00069_25/6_7e39Pkinase_Tyr/PF07714_17/5_1e20Kdo/PF06293_14/6_4e06Kinaselike/PF14531_6/1_5e05Pkinase_fungal/PF17667_1/0_18_NODE_1258_length_2013_cov_157_623100_g1002_i03391940
MGVSTLPHYVLQAAPQRTAFPPAATRTTAADKREFKPVARSPTQIHATRPATLRPEHKQVTRIPTDIYHLGPLHHHPNSQPSSPHRVATPVSYTAQPTIVRKQLPAAHQLTASTTATTTTTAPPSSRSTQPVSNNKQPLQPAYKAFASGARLRVAELPLAQSFVDNRLAPKTRTDDEARRRELLNRLDAKHLNSGRLMKEATSQVKALCVSPVSGKCYKITRVLQSAIYGGVFEAEMYYVNKVMETPPSGLPPRPVKKVALKIMLRDLEIQHRDSLQEDITAEFKFKNEMRGHPNVLAYDELWESQSKGIIYVVMPFAEFEDLFEVLKRRSVPFSEPEARWLFRQLLHGVQHLHNQGVGFRDHSLENVLMFRSDDGASVVPKITDPGQAVRIRYDSRRHEVCCLFAEKLFGKSFRPPEVYNPRKYNPIKVDVFCIGWMLFFVVTKRQPFDRTMDTDPHWKYIVKGDLDELLRIKGNAKLSPKLISLLKMMLHPQYQHRYTPQQCLEDPWFQEPECPIDDRTIWSPNPHFPAAK